SQFTTKSLFESVHVRVVLMAVRMIGFRSKSLLAAVTPWTYLPRLNLIAVLPLPNRSYATPMRGVMSCHFTCCVDRDGYTISGCAKAVQPGPPIRQLGSV